MEFNVAQLLQQQIGSTKRYLVDEPSRINDPTLELVGPIQGDVALMRTHRGVLVTARLNQNVLVQCVRCLTELEISLNIDIEEEFVPSLDPRTGAHLRWSPEDDIEEAQIIDEKHILDLHEVVRQELILAMPAHALCREDCAGICPDCGADLKVETCNCHNEAIDPRCAALTELRQSSLAK